MCQFSHAKHVSIEWKCVFGDSGKRKEKCGGTPPCRLAATSPLAEGGEKADGGGYSGAPGVGFAEVDGEVAEGVAGVDDLGRGGGGDGGGKFGKAFAEGRGVGGGRLDFTGVEASVGFKKEIDFDGARGVAVEPHVGVESAVEAGFAGFGDDEVFEEAANKRVGGDLGFVADADEPGGEAGFGKVDLGRLDLAGGDVGVPGAEPEDKEGGFKGVEPFGGSGDGDAGVAGEGFAVEELSDAPGEEADEYAEDVEVLDIDEAADVALDIGLEVVAVEGRWGDASGPEAGHETAADEGVAGDVAAESRRRKFAKREWEQVAETGTAGEGFTDGFGEVGLLGAGEDELALFAAGVHHFLDVGEEGGEALHFIDDHRLGAVCQESAGVVAGRHEDVFSFQATVLVPGEEGLGQRGFAALPGAEDGDDRIEIGQFSDKRFNRALDHDDILSGGEWAERKIARGIKSCKS